MGSNPIINPNATSHGDCLDFVNPEHTVRIRVLAPMDAMN